MKLNIKNSFYNARGIKILIIAVLLGGCSNSSILDNDSSTALTLHPADEIKQGAGFFSGETGAFNIIGNKKALETTEVKSTQMETSVSDMDLDQTSKILDDKIKQLEADQIELELLKQEVDKKIKAQ